MKSFTMCVLLIFSLFGHLAFAESDSANLIRKTLLDNGNCMLFMLGDFNSNISKSEMPQDLVKDQVMLSMTSLPVKTLPFHQAIRTLWDYNMWGRVIQHVLQQHRMFESLSKLPLCLSLIPASFMDLKQLQHQLEINNFIKVNQ